MEKLLNTQNSALQNVVASQLKESIIDAVASSRVGSHVSVDGQTRSSNSRKGKQDFCNSQHPAIQKLVVQLESSITDGNTNNLEDVTAEEAFVKAAFDWVRDEIQFQFLLDWTFGVEETLTSGEGNCLNKACLLVAILRARGLEANFKIGRFPLKGGDLVFRMAPDWVWKLFPCSSSPHCVVTVCLGKNTDNERWIVMDPSTDSALADGMRRYGNPAASFTFDGKHDAIYPSFHKLSSKTYPDIDFILQKKPTYTASVVSLMKSSTYFLRKLSSQFSSPESVGYALENYLLHGCPQIIQSVPNLPPAYPGSPLKNEFCNPRHPKVQDLVVKLRRKTKTDNEFVIAAFRWVRDNIHYTLQTEWDIPVDHTLATGQGMCSTKACLLTSILRSYGLKAGFFLMEQNAKEAFAAPEFLLDHYKSKSIHILSGVHLNGEWIKLDPYIDRYLGTSMDEANMVLEEGFSFVVDFDGDNHALGYKDRPMKFFDNIDFLMRKKSRIPTAVIRCHNVCLELMRLFGAMFSSPDDVVRAMEDYLLTFYPTLVKEVMSSKSAGGEGKPFVHNTMLRSKL